MCLRYDRLKLKLTQMENKIQFAQHVKKQLLMNKKYTIIQKEEAKKYLKLQEQYVRQVVSLIYIKLFEVSLMYIYFFLYIIYKIFFNNYRGRRNYNIN